MAPGIGPYSPWCAAAPFRAAAVERFVDVPTAAVSYRLRCGGVVPEVAYHEISLGASHRPGTVVVTAPSAVTWAATVGRAEREPSGIG
ncbi:hypothetical protein [Streptomyces griseoviridis]|uniref:hypothetical protein n=1 Tax=Streptomyces griseoviridis TaxID=45398 RepID=UPI003431563B